MRSYQHLAIIVQMSGQVALKGLHHLSYVVACQLLERGRYGVLKVGSGIVVSGRNGLVFYA